MSSKSDAISQVEVFRDRIVSWGQGYESTVARVWGAKKRYDFFRKSV